MYNLLTCMTFLETVMKVISNMYFYCSCFLRRPQKLTKSSWSIWRLLSKCQIDVEDFINFCGLLRKHELYCIRFAVQTFLKQALNYTCRSIICLWVVLAVLWPAVNMKWFKMNNFESWYEESPVFRDHNPLVQCQLHLPIRPASNILRNFDKFQNYPIYIANDFSLVHIT